MSIVRTRWPPTTICRRAADPAGACAPSPHGQKNRPPPARALVCRNRRRLKFMPRMVSLGILGAHVEVRPAPFEAVASLCRDSAPHAGPWHRRDDGGLHADPAGDAAIAARREATGTLANRRRRHVLLFDGIHPAK